MTICAAPLIYILIFVAVVVLVEGLYLTVFGKSISLNSRVSRRLALLEKNQQPRTGAGTAPQGNEPAPELARDPALLDSGDQGAKGQHRLFAQAADHDHGRAVGVLPISA